MLIIREEQITDHPGIEQVHRHGFGGDLEGKLVDRLRQNGNVVVSLVAVHDHQIVGHILFSEIVIELETGERAPAVSLAPLAVLPDFQKQGIGSQLVRKGLEVCRDRDRRIVFVLGDPAFYRRFGFSLELARWLQSPYSGDHWMALELISGALDGVRGVVRFPEAFDVLA